MNAKNVLLTHFSARYPKVPPYILRDSSLQRVTPATYQKDRAIVPAFDYLNLTIGDMWKMQFYLRPLIQAIREGGEIDDEEKARSGRSLSPARNASPMKNKRSAGFVERPSRRESKFSKKNTVHESRDSDKGHSVGRGHPVRTLPASPNNASQDSTQDSKAASKADA